jgi:trans-2,3-dihydro-3-hydroxyanthranilate isomerase
VPERGPPPPPRDVLAGVLGLAPEDVLCDVLDAPATFSAGLPFSMVPLRDRAALSRARVEVALWSQSLAGTPAHSLYVFSHATGGPSTAGAADVHARMFAPGMGIVEDAATGSASVAFVGYLHGRDGGDDRGGARRWILSQGEDMGRPSTLHVEAVVEKGQLQAARVGGSAVRVSQGTLSVGARAG